jgi:hypothetical protein
MDRIRGTLIAATLVLLVACGSPDENGADATATPEDVGPLEGDTADLSELVAALDVGCSLTEVDPTEGYDIFEQAACPDGSIVLYTFSTAQARDDVVEGIRNIDGEYAVVGGSWVVETKSRADAEKVKAELGGNIRS